MNFFKIIITIINITNENLKKYSYNIFIFIILSFSFIYNLHFFVYKY